MSRRPDDETGVTIETRGGRRSQVGGEPAAQPLQRHTRRLGNALAVAVLALVTLGCLAATHLG